MVFLGSLNNTTNATVATTRSHNKQAKLLKESKTQKNQKNNRKPSQKKSFVYYVHCLNDNNTEMQIVNTTHFDFLLISSVNKYGSKRLM